MATKRSKETKEGEPSVVRSKSDNKAILVDAVAQSAAPEWLKPYLKGIGPIFSKIGSLIDILSPLFNKGQQFILDLYKKIEPYDPDDIFSMCFGLVLIFFGGYFVTTIACIEAFRISGWDRVKKGFTLLWEDYQAFKKESDADDARDDNADGIPDVQQIGSQELVSRKFKLFLKSCSPSKLQEALAGIYTGLVGVFATLRLAFARTITLGSTIGEVIAPPAIKFLHPILSAIIPGDYHKWIDVILQYGSRSIGVSIAFFLNRIVSTVHSAMRGSQTFCAAFAKWTAKRGWTFLANGYWDEVFIAICAVLGFYVQIKSWFSLPWLLYIPLFPLVLLERVLTYVVGLSG